MGRHLVHLAALLVEPEHPVAAAHVVIAHVHAHHGADAPKGEDHRPDDGPVPPAHHVVQRYRVQQVAGLLRVEQGCLALSHDVLGPLHRSGRIDVQYPSGDQPVQAATNRRQVLLHRGGRRVHLFDVGADVNRADAVQLHQLPFLAPGEEPLHRPPVGRAGVGIPDGGDEKVDVTLEGPCAGELDDDWNVPAQLRRRVGAGWRQRGCW